MKHYMRFLALLLAGALLLACAACGGGPVEDDPPTGTTTTAAEPPGPFAAARRISTYDDLSYDSDGKPIIEEGEVLVRFHYTDNFDAEAWQALTVIDVAWGIEAINQSTLIANAGSLLRKPVENYPDNGGHLFDDSADCGFGTAVIENWMLPEDEFKAAFHALMTEAAKAEPKDFWLLPNNYSGVLNPSYVTETSCRITSYLPEQVRPNAEAIYMSTALMREHFPFLGKPEHNNATTPTSTTVSPSRTRQPMLMIRETKQDGLVLRVETNFQKHFTGEPFTLTASVTNTTGKDIAYWADITPNLHSEIAVNILGKNEKAFIDMDTWGQLSLLTGNFFTLKAGETYTQTMRFLPGASDNVRTYDLQNMNWFPAGEYEGTAVFTYLPDTYSATLDNHEKTKELTLKFPVVLV